MKLGLFSDSHYSNIAYGRRQNPLSLKKLQRAYAAFEEAECEYIVCLGDVVDTEGDHQKERKNLEKVARIFAKCPIPTVVLMGNHDAVCFTEREFYEIVGENAHPKTIKKEGKTLLFLDACYLKNGRRYSPNEKEYDWTDTFYPHLETLPALLDGECFVFIHQNLDPNVDESHIVYNANEIRAAFERSGAVKTVFQGHYHLGANNTVGGIEYITLPATCERDDGYYFIVEI